MNDNLRRLCGIAALAALAGVAACDTDLAPEFRIEGTGTVDGLLFFDADNDGLFDPSDGDEPVSDVGVAVRVRNTSAVLASGTTGADGRFSIADVAAGSHDVFFDESSVPDGLFVCENPVGATVYIDEPTFVDVASRNACLVPIVDVQQTAQTGDFAIVRGIVTASPSQFDEGDAAMQDETGGIWIRSAPLEGLGIEVGDVVEIGGTVDFGDEYLKLNGVVLRDLVPDVGAPPPVEVTTAEIAAASDPRDPLQNLLATVRAAELTTPFDAGGDRNASIDDGSGTTVVRVESVLSPDAGPGILATTGMTVGNCYDITGIVSAFFGLAEIFPRTVADIVEVPCG